MKRYNPGCRRSEAEMFEEPDGEWVRYKDAEKLEQENDRLLFFNREREAKTRQLRELNQEMLVAMRSLIFIGDPKEFLYDADNAIKRLRRVIKKAEGES